MIVTIQSYNRPQNVEKMLDALYPIVPLWYVPEVCVKDYQIAGADVVSVGVANKTVQLNESLKTIDKDYIPGEAIITMDDDLLWVARVKNKKQEKITLYDLLMETVPVFEKSDYYLGGFQTTTNPFFINQDNSKHGMVLGQLLYHKPSSNIIFDTNCLMFEDLDIIINHHVTYGGILKFGNYIVNYHMLGRSEHNDKDYSGGFGDSRTNERMNQTIEYITNKYNNIYIKLENCGPNKSVHKKVKFKKLIDGANSPNLSEFF